MVTGNEQLKSELTVLKVVLRLILTGFPCRLADLALVFELEEQPTMEVS